MAQKLADNYWGLKVVETIYTGSRNVLEFGATDTYLTGLQ